MKLRITVDQKTYEVDVEVTEDDHAPAAPAYTTYIPATPNAMPAAPPPVRASAGESNVAEDKVCRSPVAGKVKAINANVGDGVQTGQVLVEFE